VRENGFDLRSVQHGAPTIVGHPGRECGMPSLAGYVPPGDSIVQDEAGLFKESFFLRICGSIGDEARRQAAVDAGEARTQEALVAARLRMTHRTVKRRLGGRASF